MVNDNRDARELALGAGSQELHVQHQSAATVPPLDDLG